jgi:primosomal protein N' (replication factor Y)
MKWVEVVVNLPTSKLNTTFTYHVPDHLINEAVFGKRVLIDFAGQKVDGFIVAETDINGSAPSKTLLRVLDVEPVFNHSLLELARWMATYYLCPLSMALNLMVPRILQHKKGQIILPAINENEFNTLSEEGISLNAELFAQLWKNGELSISKALKYVDKDELAILEDNDYVTRSGVYRMGREYKKGYYYSVGDFDYDKDLPALQCKAPRQAEVMELLMKRPEIDRDIFDTLAASVSIRALLKKGFIIIERRAQTQVKSTLDLNEEQKLAVRQVEKALQDGKSSELLLFGVTGSGKTEVYLQAAATAIAEGRGVIVLVPEIALTRQFVDVFASRIDGIAVLHSGMSAGERYDEWRRIKAGDVRLVLGARSAIFAPVSDLGLIIMDEEQESSFKQEELPRYHTREVARMRSQMESAVMLVGSATPSIETFYAASEGSIKLLILKQRVGGGQIPKVIIEDLRRSFKNEHRGLISPILQEKIRLNLSRGEQIILFINRRGYSPVTICGECGNISSCPSCSVSMNYHRDIQQNVCHYCNHHAPQETRCSRCGSQHMQLIGAGTQRVEEEIRQLYPEASIARLDMDSSRRQGAQKSILNRMKSREIDILIGTQMVAKGLDFPFVSLVGIIDADSILYLPDFRAGERCFQLLVQAAGRAGRSGGDGEVVIQTYNPDNPIIMMAVNQDYRSFYEQEIKLRKLLNYPPFTRLLRIVFSSLGEDTVREFALAKAQYIEDIIDASEEDVMLLGPAPCPINKINNRFRYQLIIKCSSLDLLRSIASYILASVTSKNVKMEIDINPITTI